MIRNGTDLKYEQHVSFIILNDKNRKVKDKKKKNTRKKIKRIPNNKVLKNRKLNHHGENKTITMKANKRNKSENEGKQIQQVQQAGLELALIHFPGEPPLCGGNQGGIERGLFRQGWWGFSQDQPQLQRCSQSGHWRCLDCWRQTPLQVQSSLLGWCWSCERRKVHLCACIFMCSLKTTQREANTHPRTSFSMGSPAHGLSEASLCSWPTSAGTPCVSGINASP